MFSQSPFSECEKSLRTLIDVKLEPLAGTPLSHELFSSYTQAPSNNHADLAAKDYFMLF